MIDLFSSSCFSCNDANVVEHQGARNGKEPLTPCHCLHQSSKTMSAEKVPNGESGVKEPSNRCQLLPSEEKEGRDINQKNITCLQTNAESMSVKSSGGCCTERHFIKLASGISPTEICPSMTKLHFLSTRLEIYSILGALLYVLISFPWAEPVREPVLQLSVLFVLAQVLGVMAGFVRLPPLFGMLLAGILLKNLNFFDARGGFLQFTSTLRSCAMTMILLRAGLGLDASALRRLSMAVIRVATIPCTVEAVTVAIASHFLLNFPWHWGLLLGFVLGAVSPAVVVPSLLMLKSSGYGENKGVATLVIAASSLDDIYAITLFGVVLSTIFSGDSITRTLLQGPSEVVMGVTWGILMGVISIYIPHSGEKSVIKLRTIMVGASGLLAVLGSQLVGYAGAGPLGCIVGAFVAACGWKAYSPLYTYDTVMSHLTECWLLLQPFLFGLIGTEIKFSAISGENVGLGIVIIMVGVVVRFITCCVSVQGCGLNFRETLFVGLSWLPKATVQAAIGPVALDLARSHGGAENINFAEKVLTIAVLSIILTAPLGAVGILGAGPLLLTQSKTEESIIVKASEEFEERDEMDGGDKTIQGG